MIRVKQGSVIISIPDDDDATKSNYTRIPFHLIHIMEYSELDQSLEVNIIGRDETLTVPSVTLDQFNELTNTMN